jgi:hypothetical protein
MSRKRWIYVKGEAIPAEEYQPEVSTGLMVMGDLPDFRSPIDGTVVSGRAGMREHCKRHDVVPSADLAGLPNKLAVTPPKSHRAEIRQTLINEFHKRGY